MAEVKMEVKTFEIDYKCPKCESGYLRPTGNQLLVYPVKYPHVCTKCDYMESLYRQYPYIHHDLIDNKKVLSIAEDRKIGNSDESQTAVEWLEKQLYSHGSGIPAAYILFFEQAKAMEKEQRIKDYNAGYTDAQCNHINDAENYANEQEYINK